jgi:hypothetical protein
VPVIAVALGVLLLGEHPGAGAVAGLLLILAGSWRLPAVGARRCSTGGLTAEGFAAPRGRGEST